MAHNAVFARHKSKLLGFLKSLEMPVEIQKQTLITDPMIILEADIIDFNRLNGVWNNSADALKTIFSWFDQTATLTIVKVADFRDAPSRGDWPGWKHPAGRLVFSDEPDFYGQLENDGPMFWGDIGKVSASTFAMTQKGLGPQRLWISLLGDGSKQVIIESLLDISNFVGAMLHGSDQS
jgi:hypothetical protein